MSSPSAWVNDGPSFVVIGEVGNVRMFGLQAPDTSDGEFPLDLYVDYTQQPAWNASAPELKFLLRTTGLPQSAITSAKQVINDVQPGATFDQIEPMQDLVRQIRRRPRLQQTPSRNFNSLRLTLPISRRGRNLRRRFPFDRPAHARNRNPHGARRRRARYRPPRNDARHAPGPLGSQPRPRRLLGRHSILQSSNVRHHAHRPTHIFNRQRAPVARLALRLPNPIHPHHEHQPRRSPPPRLTAVVLKSFLCALCASALRALSFAFE